MTCERDAYRYWFTSAFLPINFQYIPKYIPKGVKGDRKYLNINNKHRPAAPLPLVAR